MSPIAERINLYRQKRNFQKAQMARALNTDPTNFGAMLKGTRGVTMEVCEAFLRVYTEVSAEWLMRGEGQMIKQNRVATEIIELGDNNKNNFSPTTQENDTADDETIKTLLQMINAKDERIKELTDKLLELR